MAIPEFKAFMRPFLAALEDGQERSVRDVQDEIAAEFGSTPDELAEMLPKGSKTRFYDRVQWSSTYLSQAGLIERPGRGRVRITPRGREALRLAPDRIDVTFLSRYPEFRAFSERGHKPGERVPRRRPPITPDPPSTETPEEALITSYRLMRAAVAQQLKEKLASCSPAFFERLVLDVLVAMGYGGSRQDAAQAVGRSGDGGIDGIIKEDRLGLDVLYVQAKRWATPVPEPQVREFAGSLDPHRARKGVFITASTFTTGARAYVDKIEKRIVLIDGAELAELMIDHGVGVADVETYVVRRVDADYFEE